MKKKFLANGLVLLLLWSLTACGAGGGDMSAPQTSESASGSAMYTYGWDGADMNCEAAAPEPDEALPSSGGTLPANVKMIYSARLELETQSFDEASAALSRLAAELGGWFESRRLSQGGSRYLSCVIRIPSENFSAFLDRAGDAAHTAEREEDGEDVSEAYYDSEARLATQRIKLERLQALLAQAESMEDIITLESAISDTELQIEYLTGTLRRYDSLVGYATINLSLREVYRLSSEEELPAGFGQRLGQALASGFRDGVAGLEDLIIQAARCWMALLFWAVVIAAAVAALRRWSRRKKAKAVPPPTQPEPKEPKE